MHFLDPRGSDIPECLGRSAYSCVDRVLEALIRGRADLGYGCNGSHSCLPSRTDGICIQTWSTSAVAPSSRAQCAQQKKRPLASTPCPMILHWQCSQVGAIRWMAHSKLSNTWTAPAACTSKLIA